ncbi:MAG: hypothetical protein CMH55_10310 [Myxococcales bacterium]|nr:hypothetical protein [Myxococcales bacterium]
MRTLFPPPPPLLRRALITLVVAYFVQGLLWRLKQNAIVESLELMPSDVITGQLWRLLSYGLLHGSLWHLVGNLALLYFFGLELERLLGARRLLHMLLWTTAGGGIAATLSPYLLSFMGLSPDQAVIGASGAGLGLLTAWCLYYGNRTISLFGILPLLGRQLLFGVIILEVLASVGMGNSSSAAHFGGMITAWLMVTGNWHPKRWKKAPRRRKPRPNLRVLPGGQDQDPWVH